MSVTTRQLAFWRLCRVFSGSSLLLAPLFSGPHTAFEAAAEIGQDGATAIDGDAPLTTAFTALSPPDAQKTSSFRGSNAQRYRNKAGSAGVAHSRILWSFSRFSGFPGEQAPDHGSSPRQESPEEVAFLETGEQGKQLQTGRDAGGKCIEPVAESHKDPFELALHEAEGKFSVPSLPGDVEKYAYATENAFVSLPKKCVQKLKLKPNIGDHDQSREQWMGRTQDFFKAAAAPTPAAAAASSLVQLAEQQGGSLCCGGGDDDEKKGAGANENSTEKGGAEKPAEKGDAEKPAEKGGAETPAEKGGAENPAENGGAETPVEREQEGASAARPGWTKALGSVEDCLCGWVVHTYGSGGYGFDNMRYTTMLAAAGYGIIALDSFAAKDGIDGEKTRYKAPIADLAAKEDMKYWCDNNIYDPDSTCPGRMTAPSAEEAKERWPFCYSSNGAQILKDPGFGTRGYQKYYERVYFSRKMELNYFVDKVLWPNKEQHFGKKKLFLLGNSEGGMVASRYYHENMESLLAGRIIIAWSCEYNYFLSCRENAAIGEGHANQDTPVLNMIARKDNFFGEEKSKSVADIVANGSKEDKKDGGAKEEQRYGETGGRLTGICFPQANRQQLTHLVSMQMHHTDAHGLTEHAGNLVRAAMYSFVKEPAKFAETAAREKFGGATKDDGVPEENKLIGKTCYFDEAKNKPAVGHNLWLTCRDLTGNPLTEEGHPPDESLSWPIGASGPAWGATRLVRNLLGARVPFEELPGMIGNILRALLASVARRGFDLEFRSRRTR